MENNEMNETEQEKTEILPEEETAEVPVQETAEVPAEETAEAPAEAAPEAAEAEPAKKKGGIPPVKIALAVTAVLVLAALLVSILAGGMQKSPETETVPEETGEATEATIPADGNPEDVTCKGSYTGADEDVAAARDVVIATAGEKALTVSELQVYYWMEVRQFLSQYGAYASYFGLDYTQDLDKQTCGIAEEPMTWQQYFLNTALESWHTYQAMAAEAEAKGVELKEEYQEELADLEANMGEAAAAYGFADTEDFLKNTMGAVAAFEDYRHFMEVYYRGYGFYADAADSMDLSEDAVEAFFAEHESEYSENGITRDSIAVDVRHILVYPEGADSTNVNAQEFSEEAWAAGEAQANAILEEWLAGDATEDSFAALANERSGDPGSNTNGGLYTDVTEGEMVQAFNDWCFDPDRQTGDTGVVKTNYGYHVMYFVESRPEWKMYASADLQNKLTNELVDEVVAKYPMTVTYADILLGSATIG